MLIGERFDRFVHQSYYWTAIIIVRTAATKVADFLLGDVELPRPLVIVALTALLVASWQLV